MASDGKIKVVAELDSRQFDSGLSSMEIRAKRSADTIEATIIAKSGQAGKEGADKVAEAGKEGADRVAKSSKGAGAAIQGLFAGIAQFGIQKAMDVITDSIDGATKRVDTMNNFPKVMQNFGVSAQEASKMVKQLDKGVRGLPTSLSDITATVQSFVPLTKDTQTATKTTLALNDALVAGGQSANIQRNALEQYRQMLAKGKPTLEDWRSIQSAMPAQLQQIAKYLGVGSGALAGYTANSQGLYEAMKDGKISLNDLNNAIVALDTKGGDGFKNFHDQAMDASGGIQTSVTNAKLAVERGIASIIDALRNGRNGKTLVEDLALAFEKLANVVANLIRFVEKHPLGTKIALGVFGAIETIGALAKSTNGLLTAGKKVTKAISGIGATLGGTNIASFVSLVGKLVGIVTSFVAANPITLIVGGIALAIAALVLLYNKCEGFRNVVNSIVDGVVGAVQTILSVVAPIGQFVANLAIFIIAIVTNIIDVVAKGVVAIWTGITSVLGAVAGWVNSTIIQPIIGFLSPLWNAVMSGVSYVWNAVRGVVGGIAGWIKSNVIDRIVGFFQAGWNAVMQGVNALANGIRRVFSTIAGVIKAPINGIIGGINSVIRKINSLTVPDWVPGIGGAHANFPTIPKLATGGLVQGVGTSTSDSNLAWLSSGEYVMRADTVRRYGVEFMDALNDGRLTASGSSVRNYYYQFDRNANSRWQYQQVRVGAAA